MEAGLPIRTCVIQSTSSPVALERLNREGGRKGVLTFAPAEEAVQAIWQTRRPSPGRIRGWIEHPDEVVPVSVGERHLHEALWGPRWEPVLGVALLERAEKDALTEGLLWTPLLDLASRVVDPDATGKGAPPLELIYLLDDLPVEDRNSALKALARFHSLPLVHEAGSRIRKPSQELVEEMLARRGGALGLARNPTLSNSGKEAVSRWVVSDLGDDRIGPRGPTRGDIWGRALQPALVLESLLRGGWMPPEDLRPAIHRMVTARRPEKRPPAISRLMLEKRFSAALVLCVLGDEAGLLFVEEFVYGSRIPLDPAGIRWLGKHSLLSPKVRSAVILHGRAREELRAMISAGGPLTKEETMALLQRGIIRPSRGPTPIQWTGEYCG